MVTLNLFWRGKQGIAKRARTHMSGHPGRARHTLKVAWHRFCILSSISRECCRVKAWLGSMSGDAAVLIWSLGVQNNTRPDSTCVLHTENFCRLSEAEKNFRRPKGPLWFPHPSLAEEAVPAGTTNTKHTTVEVLSFS